ncbi:hypothetical protein ACFL96_00430 [Thermoproteota archaeon]
MNQKSQSYAEDISVIGYIKLLVRYKALIGFIMAVSLAAALLYSVFAPRIFLVKTTFFLPYEGRISPVSGYARMFGMTTQAELGDYIISLVESERIRDKVVRDLSHFFNDDIELTEDKLHLKKKITIAQDKNGLFTLKYEYHDPDITLYVVRGYLDSIIMFNKELEISAQKDIIKVLDTPKKPKEYYKPRHFINIMFTLIGSLIFSAIFILVFDYVKSEWKQGN